MRIKIAEMINNKNINDYNDVMAMLEENKIDINNIPQYNIPQQNDTKEVLIVKLKNILATHNIIVASNNIIYKRLYRTAIAYDIPSNYSTEQQSAIVQQSQQSQIDTAEMKELLSRFTADFEIIDDNGEKIQGRQLLEKKRVVEVYLQQKMKINLQKLGLTHRVGTPQIKLQNQILSITTPGMLTLNDIIDTLKDVYQTENVNML